MVCLVEWTGEWMEGHASTLLTCYQHSDEQSMLKVVAEPKKSMSLGLTKPKKRGGNHGKTKAGRRTVGRSNTHYVVPGLPVAPPGLEPGLS